MPRVLQVPWDLQFNVCGGLDIDDQSTKIYVSDSLAGEEFLLKKKGNYEYVLDTTRKPDVSIKATIEIFHDGLCIKKHGNIRMWGTISTEFNIPLIPITGSLFLSFHITLYDLLENIFHNNLYDHTKHLLMSSDLADFTIIIDGEEIPVHKVILAVQISVFKSMFLVPMMESKNNRVDVDDIEFEIMKKVLKYLYTAEMDAELNIDELLKILYAADKYQIMNLMKLCENDLSKKITKQNQCLKESVCIKFQG